MAAICVSRPTNPTGNVLTDGEIRQLSELARERDIPWIRLNRYSLVQFGHGRYQRRIQATVTSETRHIAVELASGMLRDNVNDADRDRLLDEFIERIERTPAAGSAGNGR